MSAPTDAERREQSLADYRKKLLKHKEVDTKVRSLREEVKSYKKDYDKTEDDLKALQSVGQIIGEVLRQLDEERCEWARCRAAAPCADMPARLRGMKHQQAGCDVPRKSEVGACMLIRGRRSAAQLWVHQL